MSDFIKNHWASMAFVLCAIAMFVTEVYAPFMLPSWSWLLVFVALSAPVFFLGCGVNINNDKSCITFFTVSTASALIQGLISAYLLGNGCAALVVISVIFFALWYFILAAFATIVIKNSMQRDNVNQTKTKKRSNKRLFCDGEPVSVYKHKITLVEEKKEFYKLEFDDGTWINLPKLKRKGKKPAPPKVGDDITLYLYNGDFVACDLRGKKLFRLRMVEER